MPDTAVSETGQSKAKVFISYSRKDIEFVDRLDAALRARGSEPLIDRTDIYAFEQWWQRIEALIGRADTVVFVISPDAVASEIALKEIAEAASLNKRFAPVVWRRVDDKLIPEPLAKLNFILFDDETQFEQRANQLAEALRTDIGWIRQHTDFGEQARRWSQAKGVSGLLLRSPVLEQAERWIASRPAGAPAPTGDTQAFIRHSRQGATRRRNVLTGSLAAGLVLAVGLAGLAYWQRSIAVEQQQVAVEQRNRAERTLTAATETANALVADLAVRLRGAKGVPAAVVKDVVDRARKLQEQLIGAGETSPELRRSQSRALNEMATTLQTLGDINGALAVAKQAEAILTELLVLEPDNLEWRRALAASKSRIADALVKLGKNAEALAIRRDETLPILQALVAKDPTNKQWQRQLSGLYTDIAISLDDAADSGAALEAFHAALAISEMLAAREPEDRDLQRDIARNYAEIAYLLVEMGQLDEALEAANKRLAVSQALAAQDTEYTDGQWGLYNAEKLIGRVFKQQGKYVESLAAYQESGRIMQALADADPDDTERQRSLRESAELSGEILFIQRKFDEALELYRKANAISRALSAKEPNVVTWQRDLAASLSLIGDVLRQQRKLDEALASYRESKAIFAKLVERDASAAWQQNLSYVDYRIGDLLTEQRKFDEAVTEYNECLTLAKGLVAREPGRIGRQRDLAMCHARMAESLGKQSKYEEALAHYREAQMLFIAISLKDPNNGFWQRDVAVSYEHIGDMLEELARFDETLDSYRESFKRTKALVAKEPTNSLSQRDLVLIIRRLAGVLLLLGKPEEALHYFEEPAQFAADDTAMLWARGQAALYTGRVAAAVDDFAALTRLRPQTRTRCSGSTSHASVPGRTTSKSSKRMLLSWTSAAGHGRSLPSIWGMKALMPYSRRRQPPRPQPRKRASVTRIYMSALISWPARISPRPVVCLRRR
jgi:tetratricopeptide (TPR) repeat protein